jgi:signal transduction histidine kinase
MLHEFLTLHRDDLIQRCRVKMAARPAPTASDSEISHGVPLFLDQLVEVLRRHERSDPRIGQSAALHGHELLKRGFTVGQVVHGYGDVCQTITALAIERNAPISVDEFRTLNHCLDDAIADAVTAYAEDRDASTVSQEAARGNSQLGFFMHELRNLLQTATIASEVMMQGGVGLTGSTAAVLRRSLVALQALVDKSIADVRLTNAIQRRTTFSVSALIDELALAATMASASYGVTLEVAPVEQGVDVAWDRDNIAAAIRNLLQNAFKFTHSGSTVLLKTIVTADRILIEVHDECGGLPDGKSDELFHPFEQRGSNRTGLGLGLAFSQWAIVANGGRIYVRNLPGTGCVFIADLPRHPSPQFSRSLAVMSPLKDRRRTSLN